MSFTKRFFIIAADSLMAPAVLFGVRLKPVPDLRI